MCSLKDNYSSCTFFDMYSYLYIYFNLKKNFFKYLGIRRPGLQFQHWSCVIVCKPLTLSGHEVPSPVHGGNQARGPPWSLPPNTVHRRLPPFEARHLCYRNQPETLAGLSRWAVRPFYIFLLSKAHSCCWRLCGATCHWQGSCEVNDSANKKR